MLKPDGEAAGLVVPWANVETVELGRWRTRALEGAVVGVLGGALVAALAGPCAAADTGDCSGEEVLLAGIHAVLPDLGTRASVVAGVGLLAGAGFGAGIRAETWRPVQGGLSGGAVALGLSFSF